MSGSEENLVIDESVPASSRRSQRTLKRPQTLTCSENTWANSEKQTLFNALIKYGSSNIKEIAKYVGTKNENAVQVIITQYKKFARESLLPRDDEKNEQRSAPIDKWLEYILQQGVTDSQRILDLSRTIKYIAFFEHRDSNSKVDLSECYKVLSDCLRGEAPPHMNQESSFFLLQNLQKLTRIIKSENHDKEMKYLLNSAGAQNVRCYGAKRARVSSEDSAWKKAVWNPLNVPDSLLVHKKL